MSFKVLQMLNLKGMEKLGFSKHLDFQVFLAMFKQSVHCPNDATL
jgi:hypothetical protein